MRWLLPILLLAACGEDAEDKLAKPKDPVVSKKRELAETLASLDKLRGRPEKKEEAQALLKRARSLIEELKASEGTSENALVDEVLEKYEPELYERINTKQKIGLCGAIVRQFELACESYEKSNNVFPSSGNANMVKALTSPGPRYVPLIEKEGMKFNARGEVLDPWGNPYV